MSIDPVQFYKCLADDTRLRCLMLIVQHKELCVCELTEALDLSQPKVSRHLAQLRKVGLLTDRRDGQWVFYALNADLPDWCSSVLQQSSLALLGFTETNQQRLEQMEGRPNSCC